MRAAATRCAIAAAGSLVALAGGQTALTAMEVKKVEALIDLMIQLDAEMGPTSMTFRGCLNPAGQTGVQTEYEKVGTPPRDPTIAEGLKHYKELIKSGKVVKSPKQKAGTASCAPCKGIDNDVVTLSQADLTTWCDMSAEPVERAKAKLSILESLANELAHVYQCQPMGLSTMDKDKAACDGERDSDILDAKLTRAFFERLFAPPGPDETDPVPHDTLAKIEAEGKAGKLLAKCLRDLGVDTPEELLAFYGMADWADQQIRDRRDNLFGNEIAGGRSWRAAYYDGKYRSPLLVHWDRDMAALRLDRILDLTFMGRSVRLTVPDDGKRPTGEVVITRSAEGKITVTVYTRGPNGERCSHTWTDSDNDGLPDGDPVSKVLTTNNSSVTPDDSSNCYVVPPISGMGPNQWTLCHDRFDGVLWGFELDEVDVPTGVVIELARDPMLADPALGTPGAGDFWRLHDLREDVPGQVRLVFTTYGQAHMVRADPAATFVYEPATGMRWFAFSGPLAQAVAPDNASGARFIPVDSFAQLLLEGNPFALLNVESVGRGAAQPIVLASLDGDGGGAFAPPPFVVPDLWRITSVAPAAAPADHFVPSAGAPVDRVRLDFIPGHASDLLAASSDPARLVLFREAPPDTHACVREFIAMALSVSGLGTPDAEDPFRIVTTTDDIALALADPADLVIQTLADLDADGAPDDAAVISRACDEPGFSIQAIFDAADAPVVLPPTFLPFDPQTFGYVLLPGDARADVRALASDGSEWCLRNLGFGGWAFEPCPAPCPGDLSGSADPNHPDYGSPDGIVDASDFFYFLDQFVAMNAAVADLTGSADPNHPGYGVPDGIIDAADFFYFLDLFVQGC
ncbi:MAG: hypothetical protein IT439_05045 [Phycisphaerales bacterium]|nr:hypothetical protein [Phycisphaerales bacterium]